MIIIFKILGSLFVLSISFFLTALLIEKNQPVFDLSPAQRNLTALVGVFPIIGAFVTLILIILAGIWAQ